MHKMSSVQPKTLIIRLSFTCMKGNGLSNLRKCFSRGEIKTTLKV